MPVDAAFPWQLAAHLPLGGIVRVGLPAFSMLSGHACLQCHHSTAAHLMLPGLQINHTAKQLLEGTIIDSILIPFYDAAA